MLNLLATKVKVILVYIPPNCDIWVKTLSNEELSKQPPNFPRFVSFGVLLENQLPANENDYTPIHYWFRSNQTVVTLDVNRDKNGHRFATHPKEFLITIPEGCKLNLSLAE